MERCSAHVHHARVPSPCAWLLAAPVLYAGRAMSRFQTQHPSKLAALERLKRLKATSPHAERLRCWMLDHEMTADELSNYCGMDPVTVYMLLECRQRRITLLQAFALEYATNGTVQAWEWLDEPYWRMRARTTQLNSILAYQAQVTRSLVGVKLGSKTAECMQKKARLLASIFGVKWGAARKRAWADAKAQAALDLERLMEGARNDDEEAEAA